jgi:hypothetical protein
VSRVGEARSRTLRLTLRQAQGGAQGSILSDPERAQRVEGSKDACPPSFAFFASDVSLADWRRGPLLTAVATFEKSFELAI